MAATEQKQSSRTPGGSPPQQPQQTPRSYSSTGSAVSYNSSKAHQPSSTSTSPSLSPKSSPLHSSSDTLNSSVSVCSSGTGSLSSGTGSLGMQSSGVSVSSFSSASSNGSGNVCLADYLSQLIKDKKQLTQLQFPKLFYHVERLLDEEISKVRINLFHMSAGKDPLVLPDEQGAQPAVLTEKVYVPTKDYPDFNFVGRILGPRGLTAKELEKQTGCKIMIRGKGSMRDKNKETQNKGKPNWDHLNDELHVLITVEDTPERARMKLDRAVTEIQKMLVPLCEAEDELKKRQLMELAILNGTYRDGSPKPPAVQLSPVATSQYYLNPSAFLTPASVNVQAALAAGQQLRQQLAGNSLIITNTASGPMLTTAASTGRSPQQQQHLSMQQQQPQNGGGSLSSNGHHHHHQHHQQQQPQQLFAPASFSLQDAAQAAAAAGFLLTTSPYDYTAAAYSPSLAASILDYGGLGGLDYSGGGSVGGFLHR